MMNLRTFFAFFMLILPISGQAALTIEVVGGAAQQIPIAIVPSSQPANAQTLSQQQTISDIIGADLRRSGLFRVLETRGVANQPHDIAEVRYPEWSALQAQAWTIGKIEERKNDGEGRGGSERVNHGGSRRKKK